MRKLDTKRMTGPLLLACSLVLAPTSLGAQARTEGWSIGLSALLAGFRGAATDPTATDDIGLRPAGGIATGVTLTRRWGAWAASIGSSYLPTHVEAISRDVAVRDRTTDLERVRFTLLAARRLATVGEGRLEIRAGPTIDNWSADGDDDRAGMGIDAAIALQLPAGLVTIENTIGFGWSAGPFRETELPPGYDREGLRAVSVGIGIVVEL